MPGQAAPGRMASRHGLAARVLGWPPRALLAALMSVAVMILERRIRKALGSGSGSGDPAPGTRPDVAD